MSTKSRQLDTFGLASLCLFSIISGYNQVVMKVVNDGLQPVFCAGIRSLLAAVLVFVWLYCTKKPIKIEKALLPSAIFYGVIFGLEFMFLFIALDLTSVIRVTIIFYTMPVWLALMNHFFLPNDKLTYFKTSGLAIAIIGLIISVTSSKSSPENDTSLLGDLFALGGAAGWALFAFYSKNSKLSSKPADTLIFYAFAISAPMLIIFSIFFGPFIREIEPKHLLGFSFQVLYASAGFGFWVWLFKRYSGTTVASFSFLTPVLGIFFGWLLLSEELSFQLFIAGFLVTLGIYLVTRSEKSS